MKDKIYGLLILVIAAAILVLLGRKSYLSLSKNIIYTRGKINEISFHYKDQGIRFEYTFVTNKGVEASHMSFFNCGIFKVKLLRSYFINQEIPVVFDSTNPENCIMIFTKDLIKRYNIEKEISFADMQTINLLDSICGGLK